MNATTLRTAISGRLNTLKAANPQGASQDDLIQAICEEIVGHISANALVTVTVASVTAVTAGAASSGPGTGTGTIT